MKKISGMDELTGVMWRKSTYSNPSGNCVEIAEREGKIVIGGRIFVRDGKAPKTSVLAFTEQEWKAFIAGAKAGEFDMAT